MQSLDQAVRRLGMILMNASQTSNGYAALTMCASTKWNWAWPWALLGGSVRLISQAVGVLQALKMRLPWISSQSNIATLLTIVFCKHCQHVITRFWRSGNWHVCIFSTVHFLKILCCHVLSCMLIYWFSQTIFSLSVGCKMIAANRVANISVQPSRFNNPWRRKSSATTTRTARKKKLSPMSSVGPRRSANHVAREYNSIY